MVGTINLEFARVNDLDSLEGDLWTELAQHIGQIRPLGSNSFNNNQNSNNQSNNFNQNNNSQNQNQNNNSAEVPSADTHSNSSSYPSSLPGLGVIQLTLGGGFSSRAWRVPVLGMTMPRENINSGFFEVRAGAHVYLLRLQRDHFGLGIFAQGLIPASISSSGTTAEGASVKLATSAYELDAGLAVAYLPRGGGAFRGTGGFFMHSFSVNTEALPFDRQYPRISYLGAMFRGEGLVPLVANHNIAFGLLFAGEIRFAVTGDEARTAFGTSAAMTTAFGGGAGAELRLNGAAPGFSVRIMADWLRYRTAFTGPARIGTGRDSSDDYLRVHAMLSYAFGVRSHGGVSNTESRNHDEPAPTPERQSDPSPPSPQPPQPPQPRRDPFAGGS
jgi:hypothetical protein